MKYISRFLIFFLMLNTYIIASNYDNNTSKELLNLYQKLQSKLLTINKLNAQLPVIYRQRLSEALVKFASSLSDKNKIYLYFYKNSQMTILPYKTYYISLTNDSPVNYHASLETIKNKIIEKYKKQYQNYYNQYQDEVHKKILEKQREYIENYKISQIYYYPYKNIVLFVKLYNNTYTTVYLNKNQQKIKLSDILRQKFNKFNIVIK